MATAFVFPGQGSQSVGMLADLANEFPIVGDTFSEASDALGYDLWELVSQGPEACLNQTEFTQPAMLAADIATWRAWLESGGFKPDILAGHSLGEYAALVAAGALDFAPAARLVSRRGQLMQEATPDGTGAMAAILGLEDEQVRTLCVHSQGEQVVSCANFNSPGQVVIAGHVQAVERCCEAAIHAGARRAIVLPVSVPSHCALMKSAADALETVLAETEIRPPDIPVCHNVDVHVHAGPDEIRAVLAAQVWQPVLWTATVQHFESAGVSKIAECGPGRVLAGLCRRISRDFATAALTDGEAIRKTIGDWSNQ